MPFNSSGQFTRLYNFGADAAAGIQAQPARFDGEFNGIAAGLSTTVLRDGTGKPTAQMDWNGQNLINVGNLQVAGSFTQTGGTSFGPTTLTGASANLLLLQQSIGTTITNVNSVDAYTGIGTATAGAPRITLGKNAPSGDDSCFLICRGLVGDSLFSHAIRDESTITCTTTGAYAAFDAITRMTGSIHYNHLRGFQARMFYQGSGLIDEMNGFNFTPSLTSGTCTLLYGVHIVNAVLSGGATVGTQTGIFVETLSGATANYGIYVSGNPSYLGGALQINGALNGVTTIAASGQLTCQAFSATGTLGAYAAGGGIVAVGVQGASSYGGVQAYSNGSGAPKGMALNGAGGQVIVGASAPTTGAALEVNGNISGTTATLSALPVYANNAAAIGAGLTVGQFYRTSVGVLMVAF